MTRVAEENREDGVAGAKDTVSKGRIVQCCKCPWRPADGSVLHQHTSVCLPGCWQACCVYPSAWGAHLRRLSWREVSWLGTFRAGPAMRMQRPVRIMQVGTAPMRTLRVTTTCSACLQAPASYPANLEKHSPTHPAQALEPGVLGEGSQIPFLGQPSLTMAAGSDVGIG